MVEHAPTGGVWTVGVMKSGHVYDTATRGRLEHVRYGNPGYDHGHLWYIGERGADTRFGVVGLHHVAAHRVKSWGIEFTFYPKKTR